MPRRKPKSLAVSSTLPPDLPGTRDATTGQFLPGHHLTNRQLIKRIDTMLLRLQEWDTKEAGKSQWVSELIAIAQGGYGALPNHRLQALEMIGERLFGKVVERKDIALSAGPMEDRPYATLTPQALEALIRGLPAPAGEVIEGEMVPTGNEPDKQ